MRVPAAFVFLIGLAQAATITGTVTDTDGAPLPKAAIEVKSAKGAAFKAQSASDGSYTLALLPAGAYDFAVMVPGMVPFERKSVEVGEAQTVRVDARVRDFATLDTLGDGREFLADLMTQHKTPAGPAPRTTSGKPDLSGVWHGSVAAPSGPPDLLPAAQAIVKERQQNHLKDFPQARCLPLGVAMFGTFLPYRIVQSPSIVVMLSEADNPGFRQIFTDGRAHPKDLDPSWNGHSIGNWEGDTLVVDTVGFNDKTWLDLNGTPHTERMHIIERYRRPDLGHLEVELSIEDQGALRKPWILKKTSDLLTNEEVGEWVCNENNQDVAHLVGN